MSENSKNTPVAGAEQAAGAAEAVTNETTPETEKKQEQADTGVYTHVFKTPFEYSGVTYEKMTFNFARLKGADMISIESEMQASNDFALAPEVSQNFQSKIAAKAAGIGSDVIEALPMKDFNKITGAARRFLLDSGY
jgi:hypothetical protein